MRIPLIHRLRIMSSENVISYRCPEAGTVVEHHLDTAVDARQTYQPVICAACGELHFVHRNTGKLLGHEKDPA